MLPSTNTMMAKMAKIATSQIRTEDKRLSISFSF
jgi:hypothetical protein